MSAEIFSSSALAFAREQLSKRIEKTKEIIPPYNKIPKTIQYKLQDGGLITAEDFATSICQRLEIGLRQAEVTDISHISREDIDQAVTEFLNASLIFSYDTFIEDGVEIIKTPEIIVFEVVDAAGKEHKIPAEELHDSLKLYGWRHVKYLLEKKPVDNIPAWFGNETTREHDKAVVEAYKLKTECRLELGGNFSTANIRETITYKPRAITVIDEDGELYERFVTDLYYTNTNGQLVRMMPEMIRLHFNRDKYSVLIREALAKGAKDAFDSGEYFDGVKVKTNKRVSLI